MNHISVVSPADTQIVSRLNQRDVVIWLDGAKEISTIYNSLAPFENIKAIVIKSSIPITSIAYSDDWGNRQITVFSESFGTFKELLKKRDWLTRLNVKVFLPASDQINFENLKILSSLQIACGIYFDHGKVYWDELNDLLHYAIYSKSEHAAIEPFHYSASHYRPEYPTDFGDVYYNNPRRFLHINKKEQIAFSQEELNQKVFFAQGINSLNDLENNQEFLNRGASWQKFFLKPGDCSCCPSWRICLGKFADLPDKEKTCRPFFSDLLNACEFFQNKLKDNKKAKWQY